MRDRKVKELFRTKKQIFGIERIIDNQLFVLFFDQKLVFWTEQKLSSQLKDGKLAVFI